LSVYLDACVLVPLIVAEASSDRVREFVAGSSEIYVSDLGIAEVGAAVSRLVREGDASSEDADATLAYFDEWVASAVIVLPVEAADVRSAGALVRRYELKLLTPDAIHLALCEKHAHILTTLDKRLAKAAEAIGVSVITP
jgi:uncharacterized protein